MIKRVTLAMFGTMLMIAPAGAQTSTVTTTTTSPPTTTTTTTPPASANQGAFAALSLGNQKIAQALYNAQVSSRTASTTVSSTTSPTQSSSATSSSATTTSSTSTSKLSLDDIAAMKRSGQGWGEIFKQMKAAGQVQAKNLGEIVSAAAKNGATGASYKSTGPVVTSASGATSVAKRPDDDGRHGSDHTDVGGGNGQGARGGDSGTQGAVTSTHGNASAAAAGHGRGGK